MNRVPVGVCHQYSDSAIYIVFEVSGRDVVVIDIHRHAAACLDMHLDVEPVGASW